MKKNFLFKIAIITLILSLQTFAVERNRSISLDTLPSDFPKLTIDISDNPAPGYLFIGMIPNSPSGNIYGNYLMVLDSTGYPKTYRKVGSDLAKIPLNFMQAGNGQLIHIEKTPKLTTMYVSDTTLKRVDSLPSNVTTIIQGYFQLLSNGNWLVDHISDVLPMDFSKIYKGGEPNGTLQSSTIYEYDKNKNIVFTWRSPDYIPITETYTDSLVSNVPYVHINNVEQDVDGNILVSSRHLSTIFKINRLTGEIMWKLGGKHNEFTFIGEHEENAPNYFSFQHDIRRLPNGNISLFDNGTQHNPKYSRGVEYKLDEVNKTATMVWEYRSTPDIYAVAQGAVQRQPNGNVLIFWGDAALDGSIAITEVKPDNSIAFQMRFPKGYKSLRAGKYPVSWTVPAASVNKEVLEGNTYNFTKANNSTCVKMTINKLVESFYPTVTVSKYNFSPISTDFAEPIAPMVKDKRVVITLASIVELDAEVRFNADCLGITYAPENYKVYLRDTVGNGIFNQLPTTFDNKTGDLVINTTHFGEFIFAVPQAETKPGIPMLSTPNNNAKINKTKNTKFSWNPRGFFTSARLQIAADDKFASLVLDSIFKGGISAMLGNFAPDAKHYWRVCAINVSNQGEWSEVRIFTPSDPFVQLTVPNGSEKWEKDSIKKIIRWNKNIDDLVKVELFKNGTSVLVIKDSLSCPTGAYGWKIPSNVSLDTTYQIRVTSVANQLLTTISANNFSIIEPTTDVDPSYQYDANSLLGLNCYPNPLSNKTRFEFTLPNSEFVSLSIYDINGNLINNVINDYFTEGKHSIEWNCGNIPSGEYYYRINAGKYTGVKSITILK